MATAAAPSAAPQPFSPQEHARFVEGVEQYCQAHAGQVGGDACWAASRPRAEPERGRAQGARAILFDELTVEEPRARAGADARHLDRVEENPYFEAQLAVVDEGSPQRFATIAAGLPDKSEDDVRAWYEKLLGDLLEIERGARA